jgi:DNA-binding transcriptional ArsR family regulator
MIMDTALRALSDGTRREILSMVWNHERPAGEIAAHFSLTRPAVSQHLTVLLESRLVSVRRDGTRRLYQANREEIAHLRSELESFWDGRLGKLKVAAERAQKRKGKMQ